MYQYAKNYNLEEFNFQPKAQRGTRMIDFEILTYPNKDDFMYFCFLGNQILGR